MRSPSSSSITEATARCEEECSETSVVRVSAHLSPHLSSLGSKTSSSSPAIDCDQRTTRVTSSGHSYPSVGQQRLPNPVFSLGSCRSSSSRECGAEQDPQKVTLTADKEEPSTEYTYSVETLEGRRNFIEDCVHRASHMSTDRILVQMIPAMLTVATYDDSVKGVARVLPLVVRWAGESDRDVFAHFMGLIMGMCCYPERDVVREMARSLQEIVQYVSKRTVEELLIPLVMSMRVSLWSSPRAVAAALLGIFAAHEGIEQMSGVSVTQWFSYFVQLAQDDCPLVREMSIGALRQWVRVALVHGIDIEDMPLSFVRKCMCNDESDAIRCCQVDELVVLAKEVGRKKATAYLLQPFIEASKDVSWRVRYLAAKNLGVFSLLCNNPADMLDVFVLLCRDSMKETRAAAVKQLNVFSHTLVTKRIATSACLVASALACDEEALVREGVANHLHVLLSPTVIGVYSPEQVEALLVLLMDRHCHVSQSATRNLKLVVDTLVNYLRPIMLTVGVGREEGHGIPLSARGPGVCTEDDVGGVRPWTSRSCSQHIHLTSGINCKDPQSSPSSHGKKCTKPLTARPMTQENTEKRVNQQKRHPRKRGKRREAEVDDKDANRLLEHTVALLGLLAGRLPAVSESANWRTRAAVAEVLPHFCIALTHKEFLPLMNILRSLLRDPVSAVRTCTAAALVKVARIYGPEWAAATVSDLFQNEFNIKRGTSFTERVVAVQCLSRLIPIIGGLSPVDVRRKELICRWTRMATTLSEDGVANVRLALARAIADNWVWYKSCNERQEAMRRCVEQLKNDGDTEVACAMRGVNVTTEIHHGVYA
ncbi:putative HEAT repeat [Trypanosoma vivax]|uniref:Protein phosphatase 2A regulatory subunit n=1 Tax=Trypanosoma vivax (strain Y486) TaxID=1055687 RepID=G0U2A3_TRYVY|nr:putative protein phosphatase 2A regulatory subunit [Trypanosoma vivax]KAH8611150.1 putative HEAT repeat [Trypanosoma vivax]CCC50406.1 putative protein phosphatase 2A regulatory subunit [Trypanosoma vivax Y486]